MLGLKPWELQTAGGFRDLTSALTCLMAVGIVGGFGCRSFRKIPLYLRWDTSGKETGTAGGGSERQKRQSCQEANQRGIVADSGGPKVTPVPLSREASVHSQSSVVGYLPEDTLQTWIYAKKKSLLAGW